MVAFQEQTFPVTVKFYSEEPIMGSCDLLIETMIVDSKFGIQELTRNSILPETDQDWCIETLPGKPMVTVRCP